MIIENSSLKIKGSRIKQLWASMLISLGKSLQKSGEDITDRNKDKLVINPTCSFAGPFALMVNFTVNLTGKYQIIIQGDYKALYKETTDIPSLTENELFTIIYSNQKAWFKKE